MSTIKNLMIGLGLLALASNGARAENEREGHGGDGIQAQVQGMGREILVFLRSREANALPRLNLAALERAIADVTVFSRRESIPCPDPAGQLELRDACATRQPPVIYWYAEAFYGYDTSTRYMMVLHELMRVSGEGSRDEDNEVSYPIILQMNPRGTPLDPPAPAPVPAPVPAPEGNLLSRVSAGSYELYTQRVQSRPSAHLSGADQFRIGRVGNGIEITFTDHTRYGTPRWTPCSGQYCEPSLYGTHILIQPSDCDSAVCTSSVVQLHGSELVEVQLRVRPAGYRTEVRPGFQIAFAIRRIERATGLIGQWHGLGGLSDPSSPDFFVDNRSSYVRTEY